LKADDFIALPAAKTREMRPHLADATGREMGSHPFQRKSNCNRKRTTKNTKRTKETPSIDKMSIALHDVVGSRERDNY